MSRIHLAEANGQHLGFGNAAVNQTGRQLRILLSYHYFGREDLDALLAKHFTEPYPEIFLDSGAFSAKTQGVTINIQDYIAFVKRNQHRLTTYSVLDVIGSAARLQIQERMVQQIAAEVMRLTGSPDVAVLAQGEHLCMTMRGVRTPSIMTSSVMECVFRDRPEARAEFMSIAKR